MPWADTLCKRALDEGRPYTSNVAECWGDSAAPRELGIRTYVGPPVHADDGARLRHAVRGERAPSRPMPGPGSARAGVVLAPDRPAPGARTAGGRARGGQYATGRQFRTDPAHRPAESPTASRGARGVARSQRARPARRCWWRFIDLDGFKKINDTHGHEVRRRLPVRHCRAPDGRVARPAISWHGARGGSAATSSW